MELGTYDPKKVAISFGGVELSGVDEDNFIKVMQMGDGISSVAGCYGDVVRTMSPDGRHEVTLRLLQSSISNDYLSAIHKRDKKNGDGVLPLIIKDLSGRTTFYNSQAWINKPAEVTRGNKQNALEWVFTAAGGELFVGGHD